MKPAFSNYYLPHLNNFIFIFCQNRVQGSGAGSGTETGNADSLNE